MSVPPSGSFSLLHNGRYDTPSVSSHSHIAAPGPSSWRLRVSTQGPALPPANLLIRFQPQLDTLVDLRQRIGTALQRKVPFQIDAEQLTLKLGLWEVEDAEVLRDDETLVVSYDQLQAAVPVAPPAPVKVEAEAEVSRASSSRRKGKRRRSEDAGSVGPPEKRLAAPRANGHSQAQQESHRSIPNGHEDVQSADDSDSSEDDDSDDDSDDGNSESDDDSDGSSFSSSSDSSDSSIDSDGPPTEIRITPAAPIPIAVKAPAPVQKAVRRAPAPPLPPPPPRPATPPGGWVPPGKGKEHTKRRNQQRRKRDREHKEKLRLEALERMAQEHAATTEAAPAEAEAQAQAPGTEQGKSLKSSERTAVKAKSPQRGAAQVEARVAPVFHAANERRADPHKPPAAAAPRAPAAAPLEQVRREQPAPTADGREAAARLTGSKPDAAPQLNESDVADDQLSEAVVRPQRRLSHSKHTVASSTASSRSASASGPEPLDRYHTSSPDSDSERSLPTSSEFSAKTTTEEESQEEEEAKDVADEEEAPVAWTIDTVGTRRIKGRPDTPPRMPSTPARPEVLAVIEAAAQLPPGGGSLELASAPIRSLASRIAGMESMSNAPQQTRTKSKGAGAGPAPVLRRTQKGNEEDDSYVSQYRLVPPSHRDIHDIPPNIRVSRCNAARWYGDQYNYEEKEEEAEAEEPSTSVPVSIRPIVHLGDYPMAPGGGYADDEEMDEEHWDPALDYGEPEDKTGRAGPAAAAEEELDEEAMMRIAMGLPASFGQTLLGVD